MASISRTRPTAGGKIVRGRRNAGSKTPYDRPIPAAAPPQNPNWFTGLIFPTSRMIATGATKLLSSIIGPDTSSSSSSSGSESSSEDDIDGENDNYHIPFNGVDETNKNGTPSDLNRCFRKGPQLTFEKSETKRVIEKLLMQETFSREECDRLITIINSRVIDGSSIEDGHVGRLDIPDLCSKAVMEAKQWLQEKKVSSSSKSDLDHGTCTLNSVVLSQVAKGELGSPVDMAKSYMQARPPWASPSINYIESRTPSPVGRELLKEDTPYSVAGNSYSSSKKMYSLGSGSWNIQEEIRRLRSKATEDLLKTSPSTKVDLFSFALEPTSSHKSLLADKTDLGRGDKVHDLNLLPATKLIDTSLELAAGVSTYGLPAPVLETTQDGSLNEDLPSLPVTFSSAQNQDLEAIRAIEGEDHAASKSRHSSIPDLAFEDDSRLYDTTCSTAKEETELRGKPNANGFPFSGYSSYAGDIEQSRRPSDNKSPNPVSSSHDKLGNSVPTEETCELLSEASIEVPVLNEPNTTASGSQNSGSMRYEELSQELTQLNPKRRLTSETSDIVEKQQARKLSRYNRKSRGKG